MTDLAQYTDLLSAITARIQAAQTRAVFAVNAELIALYWQVGQTLHLRQVEVGWGAGVIPRLAADIRNELPEVKGFSERNLKRMLAFFRAYPDDPAFVPQPVAPLALGSAAVEATDQKVPQAVAQLGAAPFPAMRALPWGHHILLLERVKDAATRRWYVTQAVAEGWSRSTLQTQIAQGAHLRQGTLINNFAVRLPSPHSELVQQALKDPYVFDFLTLEPTFHERELETGLVAHLEKFLLELGQGFAFVGRQYPLVVSESEFYIDLLFYHLKLRAYVVIELKRGDFKPEYAGKLNFYCNVVDDTLRHAQDAPTIGLMLCQTKDSVLAEYALRGIDKPIGIASYELTRSLPATLQSALPSIEALEAELLMAQYTTMHTDSHEQADDRTSE
ncbi:YhcG family protein [Gemmatimonas sp.]|jgi:predicted nuclease of restriction endonuclease-like (RecB) superfamily|uniref:YhcG family protein n=1 Tax=Gemmatimonas sp. TaxID=1962908 RepID=UPI0037BF7213